MSPELRQMLKTAVQALANTVAVRDLYTAHHCRRVTQIVGAIARRMGAGTDFICGMHVIGQLYDLGKIAIPGDILSKPGALSRQEWALVKMHPQVGYEILKDIDFPWPVALAVQQHHERLDGSGYPCGLSGGEIILEARILAVADVVEAMTGHRPYRTALGLDQALEEICKNREKLYDPEVVDAYLDITKFLVAANI